MASPACGIHSYRETLYNTTSILPDGRCILRGQMYRCFEFESIHNYVGGNERSANHPLLSNGKPVSTITS